MEWRCTCKQEDIPSPDQCPYCKAMEWSDPNSDARDEGGEHDSD
jgi:hypothetical protein